MNARPDHRESLSGKRVTREMDTAIRRLIDKPITRAKVIELFEYRATFPAIQLWRYGHRGAPQWAVDLIRAKLSARAATDLAIGSNLRTRVSWNGTKVLSAWREQQANKKRAAEAAALQSKPDSES